MWVGLCAVNLVPIWWTDRFPSQNGPWFLLATHMFKEYNNPNWDYSKYYVRNWLPFPHLLHDTLVGLVAHVAPLLTAERIVLSLYVILLPLSVFYFLSSLAPGRRWPGYLAFLVVLHYTFMRGYHDYTLSIPLFFITVAYWYPRRDRLTVGDAVILCGLGVLTYLSHLLTFAFLAGSIGWLRLFETGRWGKAFRDALIVSSAGWVLFVVFILLSPKSNWVDKSDTSWKTPYENAKSVCGEFFFSVSEYGAALATAASVWGVLWVFAQRRRAQGTEIPGILKTLRSPLGSLLIFFIVAYFATPYKVIGWHKANMRLLPISFILMLGVLAQMLPKDLSFRRALGLLFPVVIAACGSCALLTREIVRMHSMVDTYLSGIEHVGEKPVLLSVLIDNPAFGGIRPITRARDYYHIVKGGVNGDGIAAFNTIALMSYRHYPVSDSFPPYDREATDAVAVEKLRLYDHVLVWGESERLRSQLKDAAFALVHEKGPLQVYRIQ
ncbi:MAG: hypothetical protein EHM42_08480 [Planctomycetaceae bacterium]|nr:MAG: hypothetical protein EHM42_08480 [Planctomycetaceae bacterium]